LSYGRGSLAPQCSISKLFHLPALFQASNWHHDAIGVVPIELSYLSLQKKLAAICISDIHLFLETHLGLQ
jgi:hypothetical protein